MTITYTWAVTGLKTRTEAGEQNVVVQTYWTKTGTDDEGDSGTFNGATPFTIDPTQPFTPFDQLTEEQVLGWIQGVVAANPAYAQHIDGVIQKQINLQKDPEEEPPLPWAPPEPPPEPPATENTEQPVELPQEQQQP